MEPWNELPHGEWSVSRYELAPDGDETILRLSHRRPTQGTARGSISGLHSLHDRLEELLDGVPLTDWASRASELPPLDRTPFIPGFPIAGPRPLPSRPNSSSP